jgi:hypothetical protein
MDKLSDLLQVPEHLNMYLLNNNTWEHLYFLNISYHYISLLMVKNIQIIYKSQLSFNDFTFPPKIKKYSLELYHPKINEHHNNKSILKPTSMYHTRQIFFNVLHSINTEQATEFIKILECVDNNCIYNKYDYTERTIFI